MIFFHILSKYVKTLLGKFLEVLRLYIPGFFARFNFKFFSKIDLSKDELLRDFILENTYLLKLSFFLFRFKMDSNFIVDRKVRAGAELFFNTTNNRGNVVNNSLYPRKGGSLSQLESISIQRSVLSAKSRLDKLDIPLRKLDNPFFHGNKNSYKFLTSDSLLNYSEDHMIDFINYMKLFQPPRQDPVPGKANLKKKSSRKLKQLPIKDGLNFVQDINPSLETSDFSVSPVSPPYVPNRLNFVPPNVGPYGSTFSLYASDVFSKDRRFLGRRLGSFESANSVKNLSDFNSKVGFLNSSLVGSDEEHEYTVDAPYDGDFYGRFYMINPFLVLGFLLYSFFELFFVIFLLINITGTPYDLFLFFMKYNIPYFYKNISGFPSATFIFGALVIWVHIILVFLMHVLEIIDTEHFDPPSLSWFFNFLHQFLYTIIFLSFSIFIAVECFLFFDLLVTRVFFIGTVGYPQVFSIVYSLFFDIYKILSSFSYFSFFLENFLSLRSNNLNQSFSDFYSFSIRKSFVQPDFIINSQFYRPNFFIWLFSNLVESSFFSDAYFIDKKNIYRRELIQDVRKYNYLKRLWLNFDIAAQLHTRGLNGKNYRLDFENNREFKLAHDGTQHFDWRFKRKFSTIVSKHQARRLPYLPRRSRRFGLFLGNLFSHFEPSYYLYPTVNLTTFSLFPELGFYNFSRQNFMSFMYPFGLFITGIGKLNNLTFPYKVVGFDFDTFYNTNILSSLFERYLAFKRYRSLRYATPSVYNLFYGSKLPVTSNLKRLPRDDFLYPILPQFRIKEKLIPLNFYVPKAEFYKSDFYFDPYYILYKFSFNPSAYFYLDLKIQNWLTFSNVIWNQNFHFFFKRSFKSDSSGLSFRLSNGSYKLFIGSSTLSVPRVGQYFYNYLPWLQYKFKWLLYPTATYKRFDNHRAIQYHYSKKFYYASLLKFYQVHFFRWQLAAKTFQWRTVQSRNFILHLFFYKQSELENLRNLKSFLGSLNFINSRSVSNLHLYKDSLLKISEFNSYFLNLKDCYTILVQEFLDPMVKNSEDFYIPSFTQNDFRLFQFVSDLRRVNAMQTNSVRFWSFDRYLKFLGPVMYRSDITSLMGFFAPFEYRNQIILSRFKNDSIRFSVFFPSKNSQLAGPFGNSGTFLNKFSIFRRSVIERIKEDPIPKEVGHRFRAGVLSRSWNLGQGWLKFVVPQSINSPYHKSMSLFNFGLSGIGRLPRLSRSFFHMLFFRNKVQDFVNLKTLLLKVQLMSLPCFFFGISENSFSLFWEFFLFNDAYCRNKSVSLPKRYLILFRLSNSSVDSYFLNFDSVFGKAHLGYFLILSTHRNSTSNACYNLWNQYNSVKAYNKFIFLNNFPVNQLNISGSNLSNFSFSKLPPLQFFNSNFFFFLNLSIKFCFLNIIFIGIFIL